MTARAKTLIEMITAIRAPHPVAFLAKVAASPWSLSLSGSGSNGVRSVSFCPRAFNEWAPMSKNRAATALRIPARGITKLVNTDGSLAALEPDLDLDRVRGRDVPLLPRLNSRIPRYGSKSGLPRLLVMKRTDSWIHCEVIGVHERWG